jgi:hypothetical protein
MTDLDEARDLHRKAHDWIDNLLVAGVSESAAVTALVVAATDRVMLAGGPGKAADWLRGHADNIEETMRRLGN